MLVCNESRSRHDDVSSPDRERAIVDPEEGWIEVLRIKGSHHFIRHADGRSTVVAVHSGESIGPGLLAKILRDCDLTREQLQKLM